MKTKIMILIALAFIAFPILNACDSNAKKVEDARANVQNEQNNVAGAQQNLNKAIQDSATEFQRFQKESDERITAYEKTIVDLKAKIAEEKNDDRSKNEKALVKLEKKTADIKKDLTEYKDDGKDSWKAFKVKFNNDMEAIGKSISDLFTSEPKKR